MAGLTHLAQIGEISLMKEMISLATTMMTEEEKAKVEKQASAGSSNGSGEKSSIEGGYATSPEHHIIDKKRPRTSEQRKKTAEERVETLTKQLIERLRPFVDARHPGERNGPETLAFEDKMRREAEDMKLESFGVEACSGQPIREIFDEFSFVAPPHDWIGVHDESHLVLEVEEVPWHVSSDSPVELDASLTSLSSPGLFSRLREKGALAKDVWGATKRMYVLIESPHIHAGPNLLIHQIEYSIHDTRDGATPGSR
jgi:hypothetical protein